MGKRYYVKAGDGEKGPYTKQQLQTSFNDGLLSGGTMVRKDGEDKTRPLRLVVVVSPPKVSNSAAVTVKDEGEYGIGIALGIFGSCIALLLTTNAKPQTRKGVIHGFYIMLVLVVILVVINVGRTVH